MKTSNKKGFTLIELLLAIFIFSVIMVAAIFVFAKLMQTYSASRNIQNNLENAQFALNSMAKIIREGTIISPSIDGTSDKIKVLRNGNECFGYRLSASTLETGSVSSSDCSDSITYSKAVNNVGDLKFFITHNSPTQIGHVTILIKLCSDASCSKPDTMTLQTSVSLRNYE